MNTSGPPSGTTSATASVGSGSDEVLDDDILMEFEISTGELRILSEDLEDQSGSVATPEGKRDSKTSGANFLTSVNVSASYGERLSEEEAIRAVPPGEDGLMRHALVIPDKFCTNGKLVGGLNKRDYDLSDGSIKPRRPSLPVTQSQLFTSLTKVDGPDGPRWIFNGVLNGWPSLRNFELVELEKKRTIGPLTPPDYLNSIRQTWMHYWSVDKEGKDGVSPAIRDQAKIYRAKLRGAPWSSIGWSPESPGFLFWFEAQRPEPRVTYGMRAIEEVGDERCTMVHMISHRYAVAKETPKDKLTWHSVVMLEWEHGKFCTIVEGAYLNGIGGYKGRSNWYHDKDEPVTSLYKCMPPEMICPWMTSAAEIRCYDVPVRNLSEMKEYVATYTGRDKRFIDPHYSFSHAARLTYRSRSNIAQYLINYISRDTSYSELTRNCQTLAADICGFLAGKKDVLPYHPINRIDYHNRTHFFMYDSRMYVARNKAHLKGKLAK